MSKATPKVEEAPEGVLPVCPSCKKDLETIWIERQGRGLIEQKQILMCPHCRTFLGYGVINYH